MPLAIPSILATTYAYVSGVHHQQHCYHQCTRCGILYDCKKEECKKRFYNDICSMCHNAQYIYPKTHVLLDDM